MRAARVLVVAGVVVAAGCAGSRGAPQPPAVAPAPLPAAEVDGAVAASATVVRVEPRRRLVTLEMPDGRRITVRAHARAGDLETLHPGDIVAARYYESVAIAVKRPSEATPGVVAEDVRVPRPGRDAGAAEARVVTVTARITAVDAATGRITLEAADAHPVTLKVHDAAVLADIRAGELVQVTFTEAVALALERAQ